ncbi:ATP-grasp ribosomal peptide maturase [Actinoalloteichus hymeniacidonis]|uniref:ATP-grasp ribosomal peptide maturase n=1 Tax=Actinoalloteichus hymeniacidonis TaxID=340345 RepID=A0AAC9HTT3_9PSEU|nr:ATP-grasp ribosomal peptide maturase [Actinoalloteichus hymeniacidonis]AOS65562.1 ATP-grasp ribosomal peptide maturase [Actinoalloteichus hymeniacidonis]MBB5906348.1 ATP-grasp ribosomal peptide maturase [Actinoalloteichus hymeniacidonis]
MTVLILTREFDMSADHLVRALREREIDVCRINTAWFPSQLSLSAELRSGRWSGTLNTEHRTLDLDEVRAVWYRSPEAYQLPAELSAAERHHAFMEAKYGLGGVLTSLPALWVNHPARAAGAAYKPVQLVTASRSGLRVPDTVITNEPSTVRSFTDRGKTITKLLGASSIYEEGKRKVGFTRLVDEKDLADLRGIEVTTHCFQSWVSKSFETRVTVVGDRMTAVAIRAGSASSYVDWRTDYDALSYELTEMPDEVASGVRRLMDNLGLKYGALDFVVTPDGEWIFLEVNPTGQYGWIEAKTGAALTDQLAELLGEGTP